MKSKPQKTENNEYKKETGQMIVCRERERWSRGTEGVRFVCIFIMRQSIWREVSSMSGKSWDKGKGGGEEQGGAGVIDREMWAEHRRRYGCASELSIFRCFVHEPAFTNTINSQSLANSQ